MKTNARILPELILETEQPKALIFFFYLKSKYRTSVFYKYTPEKLAKLVNNGSNKGISNNTIRKYVGWLKSKGYAAITNGNLWLISTRKLNAGKPLYTAIQSKAWTTWKQFENRVYARIIEINQKSQSFHTNMKRAALRKSKEKISVRTLRSYYGRYGSKGNKESNLFFTINSERQIAKLFNRSLYWANQLMHRLEAMGYVKLSQKVRKLPKYIPPELYTGGGFAFCNKEHTETYIHYGTIIKIVHKW
jgi:hypothetical protein